MTRAVLAIVTATGCADAPPPRNLVEHGAVEKSFFVGNILDPSDDPSFSTTVRILEDECGGGADSCTSSELGPVRWDISWELLLGRVSESQVLVAYRIESHFDIVWDSTENVIFESEQGPFNEREFMHVDWSRQLVTNPLYDFIAPFLGVPGCEFSYEWLGFYVTDPNGPDAPHFDAATGSFDVTSAISVAPPEVPTEECRALEPTEIKLRFEFQRVE